MARTARLEYAGACYHVINRGNYRRDLFSGEGAAAAFERVLEHIAADGRAWITTAGAIADAYRGQS